MRISALLEAALAEDVPYYAGVGPSYPVGMKSKARSSAKEGEVVEVPLRVGHRVQVQTKAGRPVADGYIEGIFKETGIVRVRDVASGSDVQMDVDPYHYDIWVRDQEVAGDAPKGGRPKGRYFQRPSKHGAHTGAMGMSF